MQKKSSDTPIWGQIKILSLLFIMFTGLATSLSFAQGPAMPEPGLTAFFNPTQDTLIVEMSIPDPWHITANESPDPFVSPAKIGITAPEDIWEAPLWPEPIKRPVPELETVAWEFSGVFQILVPLKKGAELPLLDSISLWVEYQACSNQICLAPQKKYWGNSAGKDSQMQSPAPLKLKPISSSEPVKKNSIGS